MTEERFSYVVEEYFRQRGTHPVTLMFKNAQVDDQFLVAVDDKIHHTFKNRDDIELITTRIVEGEYWSGVLIEFNQREFDDVDSNSWDMMQENKTLNSKLMQIYDEFAEYDTRITGFSTGSSVYSVAALEALGPNYFKTASDIRSGPTIN